MGRGSHQLSELTHACTSTYCLNRLVTLFSNCMILNTKYYVPGNIPDTIHKKNHHANREQSRSQFHVHQIS